MLVTLPQAIKNVADVLRGDQAAGHRVIGVCSAVYSVTDRLVSAVAAARSGDMDSTAQTRDKLLDVHAAIGEELIDNPAVRDDTIGYIQHTLDTEYEQACRELAALDAEEAARNTHNHEDVISSLGERFSTKLLEGHLLGRDAPARYFSGTDVIVTDGVPGNSMPDMPATAARVADNLVPSLEQGEIACVTGFYGASSDNGDITTFGRGGSDLSAAVLGRVCDADSVTLWKVECTTGTDGWMESWQPGFEGVVHDRDVTQTIDMLAYEEAAELAHFGKAVLHPETVTPIVEASIPILVKNSYDPQHPGTMICSSDVVLMTDDDTDDAAVTDTARAVSVTKSQLEQYVNKYGSSATVRDVNTTARSLAADNAQPGVPCDVALTRPGSGLEQATIVCVVGLRISDFAAHGQRALDALDDAGLACVLPERVNGSAHSLSVVVRSEDAKAAVHLLHDAFCA